jgi:hypothetical protein
MSRFHAVLCYGRSVAGLRGSRGCFIRNNALARCLLPGEAVGGGGGGGPSRPRCLLPGGALPARLDAEACALLHCLFPHPPLPFVPQNGDIKEVMDKADKMAAEIAGKA